MGKSPCIRDEVKRFGKFAILYLYKIRERNPIGKVLVTLNSRYRGGVLYDAAYDFFQSCEFLARVAGAKSKLKVWWVTKAL